MTREEAKLKKDFCKDDMCRGLMDIVNEHINNIYDDFNNRTCEKCKFYNERSLKNYRGSCELFKFMISLEFKYCNKWESK